MRLTLIIALLSTACSLMAQPHIEYYNKGNGQLQYKEYNTALSYFNRAIDVQPDFADAYAQRGYCNYLLQQYDQAIDDFVKDNTLKKDRSSYNLACLYALTGRKDEAFKSLEAHLLSEYKTNMSAIMQDGDLASLKSDARWTALTKKQWYSKFELAIFDADAKMAQGDMPGALQSLNTAISLDPSKAAAYGNRAIIHFRSGDLNASLADINKAISLDPKSTYYRDRGFLNTQLEKFTEALADYEKAVVIDPTNQVYYDLAMARYRNGSKSGALEAIRKHVGYYPKDEMGLYFAGIIASQSEYFDEAMTHFNAAIAINSSLAPVYQKRADVHFLQKRYQAAVDDLTTAVTLDPANGAAYYIRGNAKASLMDRAGACEDWKKARSLGFEDENGYIRDLCN